MGPAEFNIKFQVLDFNTSYNLLLGRPLIYMVGVVPSNLNQILMFVWREKELVIHGEGSHFGGHVPIINEVSRGTNFNIVELVNITTGDLTSQPHTPSVYKMIATVMLQNEFDPGFRLGWNSQEIIKSIQVFVKERDMVWGTSPKMMR